MRATDASANPDVVRAEHPWVAVDVVILTLLDNDLKVLLVRRGNPPFQDMWAIPGGFVQVHESLEEAALRTLREKSGVEQVYLEQLYTFGEMDRDPRMRVISVTYFALVQPDKLQPRPGVATTEATWHSMYRLPDLAFDHATILEYALKRLRYKLEYSAVAFELMPDEFTLRELQEAYMVILDDHTLDKANFRKKLRYEPPIVEPTGEERKTKGRPAALYRFREDAKREVKARRLFP
jgi:8-oxo-dGTP diphosphatase